MPDFTVRYAKKSELERVNEIRYQVNRVHSNGRPDIFRDDFCDEMKNIVYKVFDGENSDWGEMNFVDDINKTMQAK